MTDRQGGRIRGWRGCRCLIMTFLKGDLIYIVSIYTFCNANGLVNRAKK